MKYRVNSANAAKIQLQNKFELRIQNLSVDKHVWWFARPQLACPSKFLLAANSQETTWFTRTRFFNHHRKAVLWCKCLKSGHVEQVFKTAKWFHGIFIHDQNILDICQKVLRHSSATFRSRFIFPKTTFICPTKKLTRNLSFLFEKAETLSGMFGKKGKILLEKSEKPTNQTSNYTSGIYKTSRFPKCRGKWT